MTSEIDRLRELPDDRKRAFLAGLSPRDALALVYHWPSWARPEQLPPSGTWTTWLYLAGRGSGKSRSAAEFITDQVLSGKRRRVALIGEDPAAARDVMIEGQSGLCRVGHPHTRPKYEPSKRRLTWPNGAIATVFSAENPDALRGPEHDLFWGDEVAAYGRKLREVLDNLRFGLRLVGPLGHEPCGILTTTPRPLQILRDIRDDPTTVVSTGSTYGNLQNLAPAFRDAILSKYEGTRIGRQEIYAEILDDIEGALWSTALIESTRRPALDRGQYTRIVVAVDPQITKGAAHAETGIVVVGKDEDDHCDILEDLSFDATPNEWAVVARDAYYRWKADRVVAEVNQGGDMVFNTMRILDHRVACKKVRATRGKRVRAEPVAALYERGLVHHVEPFVALEKQLCLWTGDPSDQSPDRMDAMVWGVTELVLGNTFAFV